MNKKQQKPAPTKRSAPTQRDALALGTLMQVRVTKPASTVKKR